MVNLDDFTDYCYGLSYAADAFDLRLDLSVESNECVFGLLGALKNPKEMSNCKWRRY